MNATTHVLGCPVLPTLSRMSRSIYALILAASGTGLIRIVWVQDNWLVQAHVIRALLSIPAKLNLHNVLLK